MTTIALEQTQTTLSELRNVSIILRHGESTISVDRESRWISTAGSPQA